MSNFDKERAAVTFKWVSYSSPTIIIKEELLGEWHVFKRALFHEKKFMMGEKNRPTSLQDIKYTMLANYS